ncbi:hypothetical protein ACI76O_04505 [Capnocytophaga cynodegmi]|uniref:hypothetical protein n=1 Tax=Capnocytophaga cynodegmi TaxID=28189 RepID=UPI003859D33C
MSRRLYLCVVIFFMGTLFLFPQATNSLDIIKKDSTEIQKDKDFYSRVKRYFGKYKLTKNLASFFSDSSKKSPTSKQIDKELNLNYVKYQGKIIRKIEVVTLDPFGFDEKDLSKTPQKKMEVYGNTLHIKTRARTVKKQLLFSENKPMDSLLLKESERLLREQNYIRRVIIRPVEISVVSDSVDIQVVALDSWTMFFASDLTDKRGWIRVNEQNLFGLGHEAYVLYRQYFKSFSDNGKGFGYRAKNIQNTHIDLFTSYYRDYENLFSKQLVAERRFYSPYTRWAGKIGYHENRYQEDIFFKDSVYRPPLRTKIFDVYGGYAIPLKKNSLGSVNNFVISARYKNLNYAENTPDSLNVDNYFSNEHLLLSKFSLNKTNFVQDRYIFRHGDIEDVNIGHSIFLTLGTLQKNEKLHPYFGLGFSLAKYADKGYYSLNLEAGSLLMKDNVKQSVFKGESIYFSNLFSLGNWHFRQFFKTSFVVGLNRTAHPKDRVSLNEKEGILGFYSNVYGTRKLILSSQTQSYSPFSWLGFRFNPFFNVDVGFLGKENKPFFKTDIYSKVAIGFYISNDYLMFQSFQFSLCYFPRIPMEGNHIFKITNIQNDDFRLQTFQYRPPNTVIYK